MAAVSAKYDYPVPKQVVQEWSQGLGFGREVPYSEEQQQNLVSDINAIYNRILEKEPSVEKRCVITCGAPGSGKTTLLESLEEFEHFAYSDPDAVCLKQMEGTYLASDLNQAEAYNYWRPGSNAAAHTILRRLIEGGYAFRFGSTSSSPFTAGSFKYYKDKGYSIHLVHVIAPDAVRWESIQERDKEFIQTTEEDVVEKGKLVPQRLGDTYLTYADSIDFYFRGEVAADAVLTASWKRDEELSIVDQAVYDLMVEVHNGICETLDGGERFRWESSDLFEGANEMR